MLPSLSAVSKRVRRANGGGLLQATIAQPSPQNANSQLASREASRRNLYQGFHRRAGHATATAPDIASVPSNQPLSFPCLDAVESRSANLSQQRSSSGPEPSYTTGAHLRFHSAAPLLLDWGGLLPSFDIAYETWGTLNRDRSNAILIHTGLSASSHAASTQSNQKPGWWEKFIGPGAPLDTSKYFVICTNVVGSCYGSTGPSSVDPADGRRYATRFPILTMEDMVRAQFRLLDHLGIRRLYASVGSSMGGMQSLAAGVLFPDRVANIASISGCARSHPYSIALRHTQRQVLMVDPNWNRGDYYGRIPPHAGMKLAREIATVTYRSGPEWEQRFGRRRADPRRPPALCPDFLIETYLDHAGEKWCLEYDANSLLYISKAMDLFDLGIAHQRVIAESRRRQEGNVEERLRKRQRQPNGEDEMCTLKLPERPYEEQEVDIIQAESKGTRPAQSGVRTSNPSEDLIKGMAPLSDIPALVMGVASDILFPSWQQREVADTLRATGNRQVTHVELGEDKSLFGHDTFLLDIENIGGALKAFLQ